MTRKTALRFVAALLASHAVAARADPIEAEAPTDALPTEMRDVDRQPAIDRLRAAGATTVYLGVDGTHRSYMATSSDGRLHQIVYVDPTTGAATFGESFDADGSSNARRQVVRAISRYEAMADGRTPEAPLDVGPRTAGQAAALAEAATKPTDAERETPAGPRDLGMERQTFLANVSNSLATFPVGKPGTPKIYLVTSPSCGPCHEAWSDLRGLVTLGKATVVVILTAPTKAEEPLAAGVLSQQGTSLAWYSGIGSSDDGSLIPAPPAAGSAARKQVDSYVRMNTMFARDLGAARLPAIAYEDGDGNWHVEERPDASKVKASIARKAIARARAGD